MAKISERLNHIFSPSGRLMDIVGVICDFLLAGLLWLLCCIPVVTVGAATAGLYRVSFRLLRDESQGVLKDFFGGFRENFRQASLLWLLMGLGGAFLVLDLYFYLLWSSAGAFFGTVLFGLFAAATALYLLVLPWLFAYSSQFDCSIPTALRTAAWLALRHIGWSLLMVACTAGGIVFSIGFPVGFLLLPGILACLHTLCMNRVFSKYRPAEPDETKEEEA